MPWLFRTIGFGIAEPQDSRHRGRAILHIPLQDYVLLAKTRGLPIHSTCYTVHVSTTVFVTSHSSVCPARVVRSLHDTSTDAEVVVAASDRHLTHNAPRDLCESTMIEKPTVQKICAAGSLESGDANLNYASSLKSSLSS